VHLVDNGRLFKVNLERVGRHIQRLFGLILPPNDRARTLAVGRMHDQSKGRLALMKACSIRSFIIRRDYQQVFVRRNILASHDEL